jgi:AcrR family transcriptional regulator
MSGRNVTRATKPREETARKRREILRAATEVFGNKGYTKGSLAEIAEIVGMTHAGVLHHFGSKNALLLEVLLYRDETDVEHLEGHHIPGGLDLFRHLVRTAKLNEERPGIIQAFAVLSAESVTDDHPAKDFFRKRYETLRSELTEALTEICDPTDPPLAEDVASATQGIIAVMDGLQIQWLLAPDDIQLARSSAFSIDAILAAAIQGHRRRVM